MIRMTTDNQKGKSLTDIAYKTLREQIMEHTLRPGEKLDIEDLKTSLGFSRAPLGDALNRLKVEGLVISRQRVGTFVAPVAKEMIEEAFEARLMIEQWTADTIIRNVSNRQLEALSVLLQEASELLDNNKNFNFKRFSEIDHQFHLIIIQFSEHQIFEKWFKELNTHMIRIRNLYQGDAITRSKEGHREHLDILEALKQRDAEKFRKASAIHLNRSKACTLRLAL